MKSYTLPAAILLAATGLLGLGIMTSLKHASQAASQAQADAAALAAARTELAAITTGATRLAAKSQPAEQFLAIWSPHLESDASIDDIFGRLDTLAVNNVLSPSGKSFTNSSQYFFDGKQLPVESVDITVAGDFPRTLNWLGAVESAFPLARVQQVSYTGNGGSIAMATHLVFPRRFNSP